MQNGSTAVIPAISRTDLEADMKERNELLYLATMQRAGELVEKGLLKPREYDQFREKMIGKYHPEKEAIFASIRLDCLEL
jgi:hypothetical protein